MSSPKFAKGVRSFLGHAEFYCHLTKHFSKISRPLISLLTKGMQFYFNQDCLDAFQKLKKVLITAPIMLPSDWTLPFELICHKEIMRWAQF